MERIGTAQFDHEGAFMLTENKRLRFLFAAAILAAGCDNRTTTSRSSKPDTPTINELAKEARLLEELIGTDGNDEDAADALTNGFQVKTGAMKMMTACAACTASTVPMVYKWGQLLRDVWSDVLS